MSGTTKKALAGILAASMLLAVGCGGNAGSSSSSSQSSSSSASGASSSSDTNKEDVTIKFYGSDAEYNKNIIAKFEAENPHIKVEIVPIDFDKAEQVIKTGISSGSPVDVSFFWGTQISSFVNNEMALDLTPYLTADNNAWKDTFIEKYIDAGKIDGSYYAVSYQPVIETLFYNKDIFTQNSLEAPKTWDELLTVSQALKEKDIYSLGCWSGQQHQMLAFAYQTMANDGTLEDATSGKLDFTQVAALKDTGEKLKNVYDNGYWYPGEGALTAAKDQVQAAFYQGKIAMLFDAGSNLGTYKESAEFELGVMKFPLVSEDSKYGVNVVTNALFVPSNAAHPEEAVEFIKFYTSEAGQEETVKSGRLPSTKVMQDKLDDPLMKELLATTDGENVVSYNHLQNLSSQISSFLTNDFVSAVCSGQDVDSVLAQLENLRKTTVQ